MTDPAGLRTVVAGAGGPLPTGFAGFVTACTSADDHPPFGEHTLLTLHGQRQVQHARVVCRSGGDLVGFAVLSEGLDAWYLEVAVDPAWRGRGAGADLVRLARGHVASHGGGVLRMWAHAAGEVAARLARGWSSGRVLQVLERPLQPAAPRPALPAGLTLRTLDVTCESDRDAWLLLSNAAFAGHPENGDWTRAELDWRLRARWTDGARFPVVVDDGGLVAGVWTKVEAPDQAELYVVAVAPRCQGRGLGRLVVDEALRLLAERGCTRAVLYVDADNAAATALYAAAGFTLHHVDRCYQVLVPAAVRQVRQSGSASAPA